MADGKLGIWLVGACGNVATTATLGLLGLQKGLAPTTGLVTELPEFQSLALAGWDSMVVGGCDIRSPQMVATAERLASENVVPAPLVEACRAELTEIESRIRPGNFYNCGRAIESLSDLPIDSSSKSPAEIIEQTKRDINDFATEHSLDRVVVVNLASTEPPTEDDLPADWPSAEKLLAKGANCLVRASSLYAIAALDSKKSFINFSPSAGASLGAIEHLARERQTCHAGQDGKTGETLMKTVLAPMFAKRNLEVQSWVGHNIFGNLDSRVLDDPENRAAKIRTKDNVLAGTLGYAPQSLVSIENIESLGDWKTAWDHIHFRGFLGTLMTLQFTWQGSDSALAAPLVLDLVRLVDASQQAGETGALEHLACFFKRPLASPQHDFGAQHELLLDWVRKQSREGSR